MLNIVMEDSGNVRVKKEYKPPPSNSAPLQSPLQFTSFVIPLTTDLVKNW
jgi:hypothetical protein